MEQGEIPLAVPKAILFGKVKRKRPDGERSLVWIYICKKAPSVVYLTYYADGRQEGVMLNDEVFLDANPHEAFRFATDPFKLLVLATYYFLKDGIKVPYDMTMSKAYEKVLLSICEDIFQSQNDVSLDDEGSNMAKPGVHATPTEPSERASESEGANDPCSSLDSGYEESDSEGNDESAAGRHRTAQEISVDQSSHKSATSEPSIERYLVLENDEERTSHDLDDQNQHINALRERVNILQAELEEEQLQATSLAQQHTRIKVEKWQLWEDMTKEEIRELGRRDERNKRQRVV
ncbi:hypothetical protein FB567DRAFT_469727 [Paraphoma chrysanthemicola]|uniref:Uncharacterized protein n=1 Tax=Paraphoma chrysanthemicola TaxID=798071 RepID=A0A8K0R4I0_9PLEO|nr:hypothetical protein FB567DRAFT_469727 [Paraphoma chrysanthemicola]